MIDDEVVPDPVPAEDEEVLEELEVNVGNGCSGWINARNARNFAYNNIDKQRIIYSNW